VSRFTQKIDTVTVSDASPSRRWSVGLWKILVCRYAAVSHPNSYWSLVTPVTYSGKPNASVWCPSVCPSHLLFQF